MKLLSRIAVLFGVFLFFNVIQLSGQINCIFNSKESGINILSFAVSQSLQKVYYTDNGRIYVYDLELNKLLQRFELESAITNSAIAVSTDGSVVYLGSKEGKILAYSVSSEKLLWQINLPSESINCITISSDETKMYVGCKSGILYQIELFDDPMSKEIFHQKFEITDIKINSNRQVLLASSSNGHLFSIDSKSNTLLADNFCSDNWIRSIELAKEQALVYTAGDDGCLRTFKLNQQGVLNEIKKKRVSSNWLTTVSLSEVENVIAYGGVAQKIYCSTPILTYQYNVKGPVIASDVYIYNSNQISLVLSVYQNGLLLLPLKDMEVAPN